MAINLTLTTAGAALISGYTGVQPIAFDRVEVGTGRDTTTQAARTALVTPFTPVRNLDFRQESHLNDLVTFLTEDDDESAAYTFNEIGLFRGATLVGYGSVATGNLGQKLAGTIDQHLVSLQFVDGSTTSITFSTTGVDPATTRLNGSVRLTSVARARARNYGRLPAQGLTSIAQAAGDLYVAGNGNNFRSLNPSNLVTTSLRPLPTGNSDVGGLTWVGHQHAVATQLWAIVNTPADTGQVLRYDIPSNRWVPVGPGAMPPGATVHDLATKRGSNILWALYSDAGGNHVAQIDSAGNRNSSHAFPSSLTGTPKAIEWPGDDLLIWTSTGQWRLVNANITTQTTLPAFTLVAGSATNVESAAVTPEGNMWVILDAGSGNRDLAVLDPESGVAVADDTALVTTQAGLDARIAGYRFVQQGRETPEGFTEVVAGTGLMGLGTTAEPLAIEPATSLDYRAGSDNTKVLTPASTARDGLQLESTGDPANDTVEFFDANDNAQRKRWSVRTLFRSVADNATTAARGVLRIASTAEAQARSDNTTALTPQTGVRQANWVQVQPGNTSLTTTYATVATATITPSYPNAPVSVEFTALVRVAAGIRCDLQVLVGGVQVRRIDGIVNGVIGNRATQQHVELPLIRTFPGSSPTVVEVQALQSPAGSIAQLTDIQLQLVEVH